MNTSDSKMITKMFFRLLPIQILLVAISSLNSIIDGAVASNLIGPDAMAATGLYAPYSRILETINGVLLGGSQILCGQFLGKNQVERTKGIFTLDIITISIISVTASVFSLLFPSAIGFLMGSDELLMDGLCEYIRGIAIGFPAFLISTQLTAFLQLEQQEKRTYFGIGLMLVSNLLLDLLLVGTLDLGLFGLGLATSISNIIFVIVLGLYYINKKAIIQLDIKSISLADLKDIIRIGLPNATVQVCLTIRGITLNSIMLSSIGSNGLSAYTALNTFGGVFYATTAGVASATRLLISVYIGEEDRTGLIQIMKTAVFKGVSLVAGVAAVIIALCVPLTCIFFRESAGEVYELTKWGFILFPVSMPLSCFSVVFANYYQCFGKLSINTVLSIFDGVIGMVGSALLLTPVFGMMGIWYAQITNGIITTAVIFIYAIIKNRKPVSSFEELLTLPAEFGIDEKSRLDITIRSLENVVNTSENIEQFCLAHGIDRRRSMFAALCMEEMSGNIVKHGFNNKRHSIDARVVYMNNELLLRLKDDCRAFNPREAAELFSPEDITHNIGIRMVSKMAKSMTYQNTLGLNVLTIRL